MRDPAEDPLEHFNVLMLRPQIVEAVRSWEGSQFKARHLSNSETLYNPQFLSKPLAVMNDLEVFEEVNFGASNARRYEVKDQVGDEEWSWLKELSEEVYEVRILEELKNSDNPVSAVKGLERQPFYRDGRLQPLKDDRNPDTLELFEGLNLIDRDERNQLTGDKEDIEYLRSYRGNLEDAACNLEQGRSLPENLKQQREKIYSYFELPESNKTPHFR